MIPRSRLVLVAATLVTAACSPRTAEPDADARVMGNDVVTAPPDAEPGDAGTMDEGMADGSEPDAEEIDASEVDAGDVLRRDGSALPVCPGTETNTIDDAGESRFPWIVWTGREYGIAYQDDRHDPDPGDNWEVYLARVDAAGRVIDNYRITHDPPDAPRADTHLSMTWDGALLARVGVTGHRARRWHHP